MAKSPYFIIIFGVCLVGIAPALLLGAGGWDIHCQSLATRHFSASFWEGNLYPRWLPDMFAGDGSPMFFYYPPFAYYISVLFAFLGSSETLDYYPIAISTFLALLVAGVGCYYWLNSITKQQDAALLGALLFITAPSVLAYNFYYLLLYSSAWAYAWMPWLLFSARRFAHKEPYAFPQFTLFVGLLLLTNIPMTILLLPLFMGYFELHTVGKEKSVRSILRLALACLLGAGIACIFLMPSLLYMGFASIDLVWTRAQMVRDPFITSLKGAQQTWCLIYWFVSLLLTLFFWWATPRSHERSYFMIVALIALFLMMPSSEIVWDNLSVLFVIQMAERMFVLVSLAVAVLAALTYPKFKRSLYALVVLQLLVAMIVAAQSRVTQTSFAATDPDRHYLYQHDVDQYPQYLPPVPEHSLIGRFGTRDGMKEVLAHREQIRAVKGDAQLQVTRWQPRDIVITYKADAPATLQLRQFAFPGWHAVLDGKSLESRRDDTSGEFQFDVPAGSGQITLTLEKLIPEVLGKFISVACVSITALLALFELRRRKANLSNS